MDQATHIHNNDDEFLHKPFERAKTTGRLLSHEIESPETFHIRRSPPSLSFPLPRAKTEEGCVLAFTPSPTPWRRKSNFS